MSDNEQKYADIIHLPHHVSKKRPQMSMEERAAQFSPFAALTGHDAAIQETARLTEAQITLDDETVSDINAKLRILYDHAALTPLVMVTYFEPDSKKSGGAYVSVTGKLKSIDTYSGKLIFHDKSTVPITAIIDIDSEIFSALS